MAQLTNGIQFIGSLGELSGYTRSGSQKSFIRAKGGASKEKMKTDPALELTRQNASEFGGCGKAAGSVRQALAPVSHLKAPGFNINPTITRMTKAIQLLDEEGERGKRSIRFSRYKELLEGFNLHPQSPLNNVLTTQIICSIDRDAGVARISIPQLYSGINLLLPWPEQAFRFIIHVGVVPDMEYGSLGYQSVSLSKLPYAPTVYTAWQFVNKVYDGADFTIAIQNREALLPNHTILLSAGIEMGVAISDNFIMPVKKKGCARILTTA